MTRTLIALTLTLCFGACALAQSQQPPKGGAGESSPQAPISISVTTPPPNAEDVQRERQWREREVQASEDVRDFTRALTYLAIVQALITGVALLASIKAANAARESADVAREALHTTERADVVIDHFEAPHVNGNLMAGTSVVVWFQNRGRTRANNVTFEGTLGVPGGDVLPKQVAPPVVIAAGDQHPFGFSGVLGNHIPGTALHRINAGELKLRVTGILQYTDVFKRQHRVEFEGEWNTQRGSFGVSRYELD